MLEKGDDSDKDEDDDSEIDGMGDAGNKICLLFLKITLYSLLMFV